RVGHGSAIPFGGGHLRRAQRPTVAFRRTWAGAPRLQPRCRIMGDEAKEAKKEEKQKKEIAENPAREDVHEQREPNQPREGVVRKPTQTQSDRERADWEGMGQPQSRPGE